MFRILDAIVGATARSRSASSNTMRGAWPPTSSETGFIVPAACRISSLPTSVEPVKETTRTRGSSMIACPSGAGSRPGTIESTPAGSPASAKHPPISRQRGELGGPCPHWGTQRPPGGAAVEAATEVGVAPVGDVGENLAGGGGRAAEGAAVGGVAPLACYEELGQELGHRWTPHDLPFLDGLREPAGAGGRRMRRWLRA